MTRSRHSARGRRQLLAKLCLSFVALVVMDVVGAQAIHSYYRRRSPNIKDLGTSYLYGLQPNRDVLSAVWGHRHYALRTNSLGFRDRATRDVALTTNAYRIVFIGDSFTLGVGCDYEDTFVGRVDTALRERRVDVLNAGVDGYATWIYWRKIKHYVEDVGLVFDELVCCVDMSDILEDLHYARKARRTPSGRIVPSADDARTPAMRPPTPANRLRFRHRLRRHSLFVELLYRIKLQVAPALPLNDASCMWSSDDEAYERYGRRGVELAKANMQKLHEVLNRHGIRLTVVVYPWADQIHRNDLESRHVRIWRQWAAERDAAFINIFPSFVGQGDAAASIAKHFIRGDNHYNEAGHKVMARALLDHFVPRFTANGAEDGP